jgi:hypothetical protein
MVVIKPHEVFADLGCEDGAVLIEAAKKFGVFCSDIFTIDFSRLSVIYVYPFPPIVPKLSEKIIAECSKVHGYWFMIIT